MFLSKVMKIIDNKIIFYYIYYELTKNDCNVYQ